MEDAGEGLADKEVSGCVEEDFCGETDVGGQWKVEGDIAILDWNKVEEGEPGLAEVREDTEAVLIRLVAWMCASSS